ncbi:hypothetical protein ACQBJO_12950 [Janibacter sp. G349]|uniref:hypothetical protein n=1 Tax=Janibacter sp. G349 TaxID=3405424 RepID=UPI003B816C41
MSRRQPASQYEFAAVDIECPHGHLVGKALKSLAGPHAGQYGTSRGVRFEESPDADDDSGRVRGDCPQCGADVILRWSKVRDRIEANLKVGRHTDKMR